MHPAMKKLKRHTSLSPTLQAALAVIVLVLSILATREGVMKGWETALFEFIYYNPPFLLPIFLIITQLGSIYILMVLLIFYVAKQRYHIVLRMLMTGTLAYLLAGFVKEIWGRPRPDELLQGVVNLDNVIGSGFPSGHVALATALALTVGHYLPKKYNWLVPVWIVAVAYSRIYLGVHAPLDIIGGFAVGWLSYALFRQIRLYDISFAGKSSNKAKF